MSLKNTKHISSQQQTRGEKADKDISNELLVFIVKCIYVVNQLQKKKKKKNKSKKA